MEREQQLRARINRLLTGEGVAQPRLRNFAASADAAPAPPAQPDQRFSHFIPEDVQEASDLASAMMQRVRAQPDDAVAGIEHAVTLAEEQATAGTRPGLAQHALKLFLTHDERGRAFFTLAPLTQRQPRAVLPSTPVTTGAAPYRGTATPPEDRLTWFREDPLLNEHHEHWHLVYPTAPPPTADGSGTIGDRHGELFGYMHEQMLARYDAERLAVGLAPVEPFATADYTRPMPTGYDPGPIMLYSDDGSWYGYRARPADATLSDMTLGRFAQRPGAKLADQARFYDTLSQAAQTGTFPAGGRVAIDGLGDAEEANTQSPDYHGKNDPRNFKTLGNHHNDGHIHFMIFDNQAPFGVMADTTTAVRDPIFWRWHRHVDSVYSRWQNARGPLDFADAPPVTFFGGDALAYGPLSTDTLPDDVVAHGKIAPDAVGARAAAELTTSMFTRAFAVQDERGQPMDVEVTCLTHEDFVYLLPLHNTADTATSVAVRIFIAPEAAVDQREAWIEMDKFVVALAGGESTVVVRRSDASSVARKPVLRAADLTPTSGAGPSTTPVQDWCDCGWPYTLLLPRGTKAGMDFRLFVMLSPGADLNLGHPAADAHEHDAHDDAHDDCSSVSYCGVKDGVYPDVREMGYPFCRPLGAASFDAWLAQHPTMKSWRFRIRCTNL